MRRYLQIVNGVVVAEVNTSGELPSSVYHCLTCMQDEHLQPHAHWNPLAPPSKFVDDRRTADTLTFEEWKGEHQGHDVQERLIVDVTDRKSPRLGMGYDASTDTFSALAKG